MNLYQVIDFFKHDEYFSKQIRYIYERSRKEAIYREFPSDLDFRIKKILINKNIKQLYLHQYLAYCYIREGKNVLLTTATASGKTLGYFLPILQYKLENPASRSIFLYPTKALSRDQENWFRNFCDELELKFGIFTYDGDTSSSLRRKIRQSGDFIITNPDMLHSSILPSHTSWIQLFENLDFIVIDEVHTYKGIFGSHFANVLRRLIRIANHYKKDPQIVGASATIGNPEEHIEKLTERDFIVVDQDGSAKGKKVFFFYNPPIVKLQRNENRFITIEKKDFLEKNYIQISPLKETIKIARVLIQNEISTIIFCRSRKQVELLTTYLKDACRGYESKIQSYRSGYLPEERRKIEADLRAKKILAIVSTNALELGIDIGSLQASISVGYPGTIHSFYQQSGRAGRSTNISLSILIASPDRIDQFLIKNPEFILNKNPENIKINPDNLWIISEHLKCSIAEKPFRVDENLGKFAYTFRLLEYFYQHKIVTKKNDQYYWSGNANPANQFSLRSGPKKNFVIIDITNENKVLGEIDYFSAPLFLHPHAIYLHQSETYLVEDLLWDEQIAKVKQIETDYYTEAEETIRIQPLEKTLLLKNSDIQVYQGEVAIRTTPTIFKKIRFYTHENIGWGEIHLPEMEMHTQSFWILFREDLISAESIGIVLSCMAHSLSLISTIFAMCEESDVRFVAEVKNPFFNAPCIFVYDNFPGGLEISYFIFRNLELILEEAIFNIQKCDCNQGCPACIGLKYQTDPDSKKNYKVITINYLQILLSSLKNS